MSNKASGNALFLILIAVALFAALSYAVTTSTHGTGKNVDVEKARLQQAVVDSYIASLNTGLMRLQMSGCATINYTIPKDFSAGNKDCHLFHKDGGGVIYQDLGVDECTIQGIDITTLTLGEGCGGMVYAGTMGGKRLYMAPSNQSNSTQYDNNTGYYVTGATSATDGKANTTLLVEGGARFRAANLCRAMGEKWYLPALNELSTLYTNRVASGLSASLAGVTEFWSSTEVAIHGATSVNMNTGAVQSPKTKNGSVGVRCVRSE